MENWICLLLGWPVGVSVGIVLSKLMCEGLALYGQPLFLRQQILNSKGGEVRLSTGCFSPGCYFSAATETKL